MRGEMTYEFHLSGDKKFRKYMYIYYEKMLTSFGTLASITPSISYT